MFRCRLEKKKEKSEMEISEWESKQPTTISSTLKIRRSLFFFRLKPSHCIKKLLY